MDRSHLRTAPAPDPRPTDVGALQLLTHPPRSTQWRAEALWAAMSPASPARRRYESKVATGAPTQCWPWLGALSPRGHGRFWVTRHTPTDAGAGNRVDLVVIAHRFGYALAHGLATLDTAPVLAHTCDEPWCQNPDHLEISTHADNRHDWLTRRWHPRSPLRDTRGPGGRARAVRDAARSGGDITAAKAVGVSALDQGQMLLW